MIMRVKKNLKGNYKDLTYHFKRKESRPKPKSET